MITRMYDDIGGLLLIFILIVLFFFLIERKDSNRRNKEKLQFQKKLKESLKNKRIDDISQIKRLYSSIVNKNYFYLEIWSQELLFDLEIKDKIEFDKLNEIIKQIEFQDPFNGLPDEEKEVLSTLLHDKTTNKELFENKLHRLSDIMKAKYAKKEKSDKWIIWLTIASFLLTVYGVKIS